MSKKRRDIFCPNCGKKVRYGSQHAVGRTQLAAEWTCTKRELR